MRAHTAGPHREDQGPSRSSIPPAPGPPGRPTNRPTFYFWLEPHPGHPKVSGQTHPLGRCVRAALATPLAPVR